MIHPLTDCKIKNIPESTKDNLTLDLHLRDKDGKIHDYSEINY